MRVYSRLQPGYKIYEPSGQRSRVEDRLESSRERHANSDAAFIFLVRNYFYDIFFPAFFRQREVWVR